MKQPDYDPVHLRGLLAPAATRLKRMAEIDGVRSFGDGCAVTIELDDEAGITPETASEAIGPFASAVDLLCATMDALGAADPPTFAAVGLVINETTERFSYMVGAWVGAVFAEPIETGWNVIDIRRVYASLTASDNYLRERFEAEGPAMREALLSQVAERAVEAGVWGTPPTDDTDWN